MARRIRGVVSKLAKGARDRIPVWRYRPRGLGMLGVYDPQTHELVRKVWMHATTGEDGEEYWEVDEPIEITPDDLVYCVIGGVEGPVPVPYSYRGTGRLRLIRN